LDSFSLLYLLRLAHSLAMQEVVGRAKQIAPATVSCLMIIVWIQRRVGKLNCVIVANIVFLY